jgi:hypothetical protein
MRTTEYTSASRYFNECIDVSTQKRKKRCKFYYTVMQTFDALRMRHDPQFRRFLDTRDVRGIIAGAARKWITRSYYRGRICVCIRPSKYGLMHTFLFFIETKIIQAQKEEEVSLLYSCFVLSSELNIQERNFFAALALHDIGFDTDICLIILPGKTRYTGIPLAMMPRFLKF